MILDSKIENPSLEKKRRCNIVNLFLQGADSDAAGAAFIEIGDEASFYRMTDVQAEIAREEGTEALIEGFGLPSGRAARSF